MLPPPLSLSSSPPMYVYVVCCMLYVVCCMLYVVCCMLYVVCCMFYVVCCMLYVVCCILYVVCCMLYVVCCMLYVVCCMYVGLLRSEFMKTSQEHHTKHFRSYVKPYFKCVSLLLKGCLTFCHLVWILLSKNSKQFRNKQKSTT